jgi:hypothetical protein
MNARRLAISILAVAGCAALIWTAGAAVSVWAQGGGAVQPQGMVSPLLQYQGRLTDPDTGDPVSGTVTIFFRIYDSASGGNKLWEEGKDLAVSAGLFSTALGDLTPLDRTMFNGQSLWLAVKVGTDAEATPRQQFLPVAYALSLAPGALISTTSTAPALLVRNQGGGYALQLEGSLYVSGNLVGGAHQHGGADISSGTVAEARIDPLLTRDTELAAAIGAHNAITQAHHTRYTDPEAWNAVLARDGSGSGLDADKLDGLHAGSMVLKVDEGLVAGGVYTLTIPHFIPWSLQLSSEWPGSGGTAQVQGFENDGRTAITFVKYDGTGVGAAGGAQCDHPTQDPLLQFGQGAYSYTLRCPGTATDQHQLVLSVAGTLRLSYRLMY